MSIAPYQPPEPPRAWIALLPNAVELAKAVANTDFVPAGLRGNPAAITACILYGDEVGLPPMQALAHIAVIDGRPSMSAEAMRGQVLAAGHFLWIEEATNTRVTVAGRRRDDDQTSRVTWTMDDARRANLVGKSNWRKYPRAMLIARATAELARSIFADAIGGLAATEEVEDAELETEPTSTSTRRRRRAALAPVSSGPTPSDDEPAADDGEVTAGSGPTENSAEVGLGENAPASPAATDTPEPDAPATVAEHEALRKKLMATYRERGFDQREARLAFARFVTGRPVESSNDLTVEEASRIIDALEAHGAGPGQASG